VRVAGAVALVGGDREVRGAAVGLDDDALVGPQEVDLPALDEVIDQRPRVSSSWR
jgi:hypothetical protein